MTRTLTRQFVSCLLRLSQSSADRRGVYWEQISFSSLPDGQWDRIPFLKSAKNHELPRSRASNTMCSRYTKACWVDFPETAICLGSRRDVIPGRTLKSVNPSIIFVMWQVSDIGLRSYSIDCGSLCLSIGQIIALSRRLGTNSSLSDVLYTSIVFNDRAKIESEGLQYAV